MTIIEQSPVRSAFLAVVGVMVATLVGAGIAFNPSAGVAETFRELPEFTHASPDDWINSEPLSVAELRGQVVLLDFWTFECWNCYRSFPWLKAVEERYAAAGLTVIGVHSPEFERERVRANVAEKVAQFGLHHPVMIDNDFSYWRALENRYWPAFYLVDKQGNIRSVSVGETHAGDRRAAAVEQRIEELLAESYGESP